MRSTRPNVLWLFCDELRADAVGCYGNDHALIETPHIDSIAEAGVRFDRFYVDSPVCVSSRAAYKTGLLPTRTGVYHNEGMWLDVPEGVESFVERFRRAGYLAVNLGKEHVPAAIRGFDTSRPEGGSQFDLVMQAGAMRDRLGLITEGLSMNAATWPDDIPFPPQQLTENAVSWLEHDRPDDRPWLLRVSYLQPHTPVIPPEPWASKYDHEPWPDAFGPNHGLSEFERIFATAPNPDLSPEQIVAAQSRYHGLVAWVDDQIGEILATLDRLDLRGETIIVLASDHGAQLGELGGAYSKQTFSPWSHRVPFIVSWPSQLGVGTENAEIAHGVDLGPTLLDLAGLERADHCDGRSLFADPPPPSILGAIGYGVSGVSALALIDRGWWPDGKGWPQRFCVRTERWRYDRSTRQDGEALELEHHDPFLADGHADPREEHNVVHEPSNAAIVAELEAVVAEAFASAPQVSLDDYARYRARRDEQLQRHLKEWGNP